MDVVWDKLYGRCVEILSQLEWKYFIHTKSLIKYSYFKAGVFPPSQQNTITTPPKTFAYEAIFH